MLSTLLFQTSVYNWYHAKEVYREKPIFCGIRSEIARNTKEIILSVCVYLHV